VSLADADSATHEPRLGRGPKFPGVGARQIAIKGDEEQNHKNPITNI
jgi:hypothetical protein